MHSEEPDKRHIKTLIEDFISNIEQSVIKYKEDNEALELNFKDICMNTLKESSSL